MPSTSRKRSSAKSARCHRAEHGPKRTKFAVTVVWGGRDLTPRTTVTPDRRKALRIARSIAANGARIVLVKKGDSHASMKLIADFSRVGGA